MKLHLGSGSVKIEGWLNIDIDAPEADLRLDLRKMLPFDDGSIAFIFSEHFLEHITRDEALGLLKECHRVLNEEGILRLSTPDLKFLVTSYLSRNIHEWGELWQPANPCYLLNEGMRSWGHQFLYDAEEIIRILKEAGFSDIDFVSWRKSAIGELNGLESRPYHHELIIEAVKNAPERSIDKIIETQKEHESWTEGEKRMLSDRLKSLELLVTDQAAHVRSLEEERETRIHHIVGLERIIAQQTERVGAIEAELKDFRSSWYGKLKSFFSKS